MAGIKRGDNARLNVHPIEGVATLVKFDEDTGEKRIQLEWLDADGVTQSRWFSEAELEVLPPSPPPSA
jgi:hypothetical protein